MAITFTVDGVSKGVTRININASQGEKARLTAELVSANGSDRPDIDAEISVLDGSELIFGGTLKTPTLKGMGDSIVSVVTHMSALDFNEIADRDVATIIIPAGNVKAAATALIPYLDGVTLDAGQANGPSLPELVYTDAYIRDIIKDIEARSNWLGRIDFSKVLKFFALGSVNAPWNIADGDGNTFGEMEVSKSRIDYANRLIIKFTADAVSAYAFFRVIGTNFSDGEEVEIGGRTYTFQTTLTDSNGNVLIGATGADSIDNLNAAIGLAGGAGSLYAASMTVHDAVVSFVFLTGMLKVIASTAGAAGNSIDVSTDSADFEWITEGAVGTSTLRFGSDEALTNSTEVSDLTEIGLYGRYTKIIEAANVRTLASATDLGSALISVYIETQRTVTYQTRRSGLQTGMTQTIQRANRYINESCLITAINTVLQEGYLVRTVTAVTGTAYKGNKWLQTYRQWSGSSSGSSISATGLSGGGVGGGANKTVYMLGGSPEVWVQSPTPTWVPASGVGSEGGLEYEIDTAVRGSAVGTVRVRIRAASGSVTARLYDVTNATQVGISDTVTSTTYVTKSFNVTLSTGIAQYRLELLPGTANVDVNGVGYLE